MLIGLVRTNFLKKALVTFVVQAVHVLFSGFAWLLFSCCRLPLKFDFLNCFQIVKFQVELRNTREMDSPQKALKVSNITNTTLFL